MNTIELKGDAQAFKEIIEGTISEFVDDIIPRINHAAFAECSQLRMVSCANVTSVGASIFYNCDALSEIYLPMLSSCPNSAFKACGILHAEFPRISSITSSMFTECSSLLTASFPSAKIVAWGGFRSCYSLRNAYFPIASLIVNMAFENCKSLISVYLLSTSVAILSNSNAFLNTPMINSTFTGSFGSIYVPASLVDSYKSANNWSVYADRITAYTE